MYTRETKQQFWTRFGQYMRPVPGAEGLPVNWINYKTGIKHIFFRLEANGSRATIAIEITHPDVELRQQFYRQFLQLKQVLEESTGEIWDWHPTAVNEEGIPIAKIDRHIEGVSVYDETTWPLIISFLKTRIIALDEFWSMVKEGF